jgi:RNA polymerase sigma factor (sigma-70 family)
VPTPTRSELGLAMRRLAEGERAAIDEVYRGLRGPVSELCRRLLDGAPEAEDVTSETLGEIFARASEFDPDRDVVAWAITIATWRCRTERRRRQRARLSPLDEAALAPADGNPEEAYLSREAHAILESARAQLGELDREALAAVLGGAPLSAALRKRKERLLPRLRRLLGGAP